MPSRDDIAAARANVAVYAQYTKLTRRGDWLVGRCPLHDDRHPSFGVRDGQWKCWAGCGYGDTIDFIQQLKHCGFVEAVKDLAANGYSVPSPSRLATRAAGSNSKNSNKDSLVQRIRPISPESRNYIFRAAASGCAPSRFRRPYVVIREFGVRRAVPRAHALWRPSARALSSLRYSGFGQSFPMLRARRKVPVALI